MVAAVAWLAVAGDDFYRRAGQYLLESALDREVRLDGTFAVTLGLEPTLVVTGISVANAPWAETAEMARIDRVEVQVALMPLLSGVVEIPRLAIAGATLDLEIAADGRANWETPGSQSVDLKDLVIPLVKFVAVDNVAIGYTDRRSDSRTDFFLDSLRNTVSGEAATMAVDGKGRLDDTPFQISGKFGSIEDAIAAAAPYPLQLSIALTDATVELTGTVRNLPDAEGFDVRVSARTPSLGEVLQTYGIDPVLAGSVDASARVTGDLESLAVEDLSVAIVGPSGRGLHAQGSLSDLWNGNGLDLRFDGRLGPETTPLVRQLPDGVRDFERLDVSGRVTGNLEAPAFEDLRVEAGYPSGADLTVTGRLALDLSAERTALSALSGSATLYVPDTALLEPALGTKLPDLGALHATSNVSVAAGRLTLDSLEVHSEALGDLEVTAKGPLGEFAASGFDFRPDPRLALSATVGQSRPLLWYLDESLPDFGPIDASATLVSGPEGSYRLDDIHATLGSKSTPWVAAEGSLGSLRPGGDVPVADIALMVNLAGPSVAALARMFGREVPELGKFEGRFVVNGSSESVSVSDARLITTGPAGLDGQLLGEIADLSFSPDFVAKGIVFDISAKSESTQGIAALVGRQLPEWGPVRASATLKGGSRRLALNGVTIAAGAPDDPAVRVFGKIGDLLSLKDVDATGRFKVETAGLFALAGLETHSPLGRIQGSFGLSDEDGSLGLDSLKADSIDTDLFSLSLAGKFDDFAKHDELVLRADLAVPSPAALGDALGFDAAGLGAFSFTGNVDGGDEQLRADGKARVGATLISGTLSGSLVGNRPSFRGKLSSPVVHFADFGLISGEESPKAGPAKTEPGSPGFGERPIPFEYLKEVDLDLDVTLDRLEGIQQFGIGKAEARVSLVDGLLRIDPVQFTLVGGGAEMRLVADARPTPPTVQFHLKVESADFGKLLKQLESDVAFEGKLDALVDVAAAGTTPNALAAALSGQADAAVEHGRLGSSFLNLVGQDFQSWLFSKALRRGYTKVNCFVTRLRGENGRENVELLVLDTPNVRILGQGEIDLRKRTIDIRFEPKPKVKSFTSLTTPFSIKGPLADPSIQVSTTGIAARTVGEILKTPIVILRALFPVSSHYRKDIKHSCAQLLWPTEQ
jgi:uncharacterized protein involved in outer membrane biogenesis